MSCSNTGDHAAAERLAKPSQSLGLVEAHNNLAACCSRASAFPSGRKFEEALRRGPATPA